MNNDIMPPRRSPEPPIPPLQPAVVHETTPQQQLNTTKKQRRIWQKLLVGFVVLAILCGVTAFGAYLWYNNELRPVSDDVKAAHVRVTIESGASPDAIASELHDKKLIRDTLAFSIYIQLSGTKNKLQAGTFSLSPHESTQDIVGRLTSGKVDELTLTFLPGATIAEDKAVLMKAGYNKAAVDAAFEKTYDSPLFAGKPAASDLEGYIYGETYSFSTQATPEEILERTFKEFNTQVQSNGLAAEFQKHGLSLYQGITLASIIQREISSSSPNTPNTDQKQVAQVFYSRLAMNMPLGSDVTAYYGADQAGIPRSITVDTPYNTRIHTGLPPGPVATPSLGALLAAAHPAAGTYLYFLSGDDSVTYFSYTDEQHQQNITQHCSVKCSAP